MSQLSISTRRELESAIAEFNPDRHPDFRLPTAQRLAEYATARKQPGFEWPRFAETSSQNKQNPYCMKCGQFSKAYKQHFDSKGIASIHVYSPAHEYLLLPVQEAGRIDVLIFDPTAEQMYKHADTTYFLGTKAELEKFHAQKTAAREFVDILGTASMPLSLHHYYFNMLKIRDSAGFSFRKEEFPEALHEFFKDSPEELNQLQTGIQTTTPHADNLDERSAGEGLSRGGQRTPPTPRTHGWAGSV